MAISDVACGGSRSDPPLFVTCRRTVLVECSFPLSVSPTGEFSRVLAGGHAGPRERARFRIEAEAVARLQHPNIVQIHEVGEVDGQPYCALEFIEGGNLASKLNDKPMPSREAAKLVEALARAIQLA